MYLFCAAPSSCPEPLSFPCAASSPGQRAASGGATEPSRQVALGSFSRDTALRDRARGLPLLLHLSPQGPRDSARDEACSQPCTEPSIWSLILPWTGLCKTSAPSLSSDTVADTPSHPQLSPLRLLATLRALSLSILRFRGPGWALTSWVSWEHPKFAHGMQPPSRLCHPCLGHRNGLEESGGRKSLLTALESWFQHSGAAHTFIELSIPNGQKEDAFPLRKLSEMAAELMLKSCSRLKAKSFTGVGIKGRDLAGTFLWTENQPCPLCFGFPCGSDGKESAFDPWVRRIPWSRTWSPTPVCLPGKFHGQRSLEGYSPWGRKESDLT